MDAAEQLELELGDRVACPKCRMKCNKEEVWHMGVCHTCFLLSLGVVL